MSDIVDDGHFASHETPCVIEGNHIFLFAQTRKLMNIKVRQPGSIFAYKSPGPSFGRQTLVADKNGGREIQHSDRAQDVDELVNLV